MTKSILLTRSKEANDLVKNQLKKCDYKFVESNLIEYEMLDIDQTLINTYENIVITSFFLANQMPEAQVSKNIWVVGKASAKILSDKGYNISFCGDTALSVRQNIPEDVYKDTIYLSGDQITIDMPKLVKRHIVYKVSYLQSLTNEQIEEIKKGLDYVLLYSTNCAKTLAKLLYENNLLKFLAKTTIIVISSKVGASVSSYFKKVEVKQGADSILKFLKKNA